MRRNNKTKTQKKTKKAPLLTEVSRGAFLRHFHVNFFDKVENG
jgi:hypothetical protein